MHFHLNIDQIHYILAMQYTQKYITISLLHSKEKIQYSNVKCRIWDDAWN